MAALPWAALAVCRLWGSPVHGWAMSMVLALPPDSSQSANRVSTSFCYPSWLQQEMVTTQVDLLRANVRQVTWCLLWAAEEQSWISEDSSNLLIFSAYIVSRNRPRDETVCFIGWNCAFHRMKLWVSWDETVSFIGWNCEFHRMKLWVS